MTAQMDPGLAKEMFESGLITHEDMLRLTGETVTEFESNNETDVLDRDMSQDDGDAVRVEDMTDLHEHLDEELEYIDRRQELYHEQESTTDYVPADETEGVETQPATTPARKPRKAAAKSAGGVSKRTPRVAQAGSLGAYAASLVGAQAMLTASSVSPVEVVALVNSLPKKVQEKAVGLLGNTVGKDSLSVFVKIALRLMKENGKLSAASLVKAYTDGHICKSYSLGTARSQAQQVMTLFSRFAMIDGTGVPRQDSVILNKIGGF